MKYTKLLKIYLQVTFIYLDKDNQPYEKLFKNIKIPPHKKSNITELVGQPKPIAIILNSSDNSYFRQIFDLNSIKFFETKNSKIKSNVTKIVIIRDLYEMVREGLVSPNLFIELAKVHVSIIYVLFKIYYYQNLYILLNT